MKNFILPILLVIIFGSVYAQNNVILNIHHKLGENNFSLNTPSTNNLSNSFNVIRLEYYISKISITHDGGTVTPVPDFWILVNASEATSVDLGSYDINSVEKIEFFVGVEPAYNHEDLASYPTGHPLGPQNPSMHWGWASGYRFVAMEGNGGNNLDQVYELHGLGDENYFQHRTELSALADNGIVTIDLDADYNRALEDIDVSSGLIVHGFNNEAKQILENFKFHVFSPTYEIASSSNDFDEINHFEIYPNPAEIGQVNILLSAKDHRYNLIVSDVLGKRVHIVENILGESNSPLKFQKTGLYFVQLIKGGEILSTKKIMIK